MKVKVLPERAKGSPLDWDSENVLSYNYLNTVDINQCINCGASVEMDQIREGYWFSDVVENRQLFGFMEVFE